MSSRGHNFHLPLVRASLADWLKSRRKKRRHSDIAAFATEQAGTDFDLDRDLEAAGIDAIEPDLLAVEDGIRAAIDLDS